MVLRLFRGSGRVADDNMDSPTDKGSEKPMTDFQREMILAERHAENVRKRQRENLLNKDASGSGKGGREQDMEEGMIMEDPLEGFQEEIHFPKPQESGDIGRTALFEDEVEEIQYAQASLVNRARVSKQRALHILEHPHCSKYLVGTVMRVLVMLSDAPDSVGSVHPNLVGTHVVFKLERLVKVKDYPVYGYNFGNHCDHDIREFMGNANYHFIGRVLTGQQSTAVCKVHLNEICSAPISQEEIKFGGEFITRDLTRAAANLRSFTFTDEDVKLMLERKLLKESSTPVEFNGNRSKLIVAIQRISHEIELLTEMVQNDPSKLDQLRALENRKAEMDEQLQKMKAPTRTPLFVRNCAVLRASCEPNSRAGVMRKITQPTPMIMFNNPEIQQTTSHGNRKRERRSITDLTATEQRQLVKAYVEHIKNWDINKWEPKEGENSMEDSLDDISRFPGMTTLEAYEGSS